MKPIKRIWLNVLQLVAFVTISTVASAQLKADFSATPTTGCPPVIVDFRDMSTGNATSWQWDLGNGTTSFEQHPKTTYFDPGTYTVRLIVKNGTSTDTITRTKFIVVNATPDVKFKASDSTGCYPLKVNFTDLSTAGSGTLTLWQWDFGDGTLSSLKNPTHTYTNAGSFSVTLRVYNSNGCVKVYTKPAFVNLSEGVKANFTFVSGGGCQSPTPVTFTNTTLGTGTIKYIWNFGDGNSSTLTNPVNNYSTAGAYSVRLIATNSSGCADTLLQPNAINIGFVKANFTFVDKACAGTGVTFTNTSTPNIVSSVWYFSDGTTSTTINPIKSFAAAGVYQVKLVNDFGSCKDSLVKNITILGKPTAAFTATNTSSCKMPLVVSYQNTSTNGVSYDWTFGDGTTSTQQSPSHTYTASGSYSVRLVVTNAAGCKDTITQTDLIKIIPPTIVTINNIPVKSCLPYTATPVAVIQSPIPVTSYFWDFGDGTTSTAANPSHTYTKPGAFAIKLVIATGSGCVDSFVSTKAVLVGNKPTPKFVATPRDICAEIPIDFSDTAKDDSITDWYWTFGDGGTSILQNPKHAYTDTGFFNVSLTVTSFGCSDTLSIKNYVHISPPIANFDTAYSCSDRLTRRFKDKSIGATTWDWDFGDGSTSTQQNPTHTYAAPGVYSVLLRVTNGSCENKKKFDVKVVKEAGQLNQSSDIVCRNARVTVSVDNVNKTNITNYTWYFSGISGAPVTTSSSPVAWAFNTAGTYPVAVVTYDVLGCRDTLTAAVPISIYGPKVAFASPIAGACLGTTIKFDETSVADQTHPITSYIWSYGDGAADTLATTPSSHRYDTAGVFNVSLKVIDSYGCRDSIAKPALITISNPKVNYTVSDTLICPGSPITFTNLSTGGVQPKYTWDFGDTKTSANTNEVHIYTTSGNYTTSLSVKDQFGCSDSKAVNIKVFPAVSDFLMSKSFSSCPPLLVDFTNTSTSFTGFGWDFGDGGKSILASPSHLYTYPGVYKVKLWVNSNGGCSDTMTKTVTIQGPTGTFDYTPKTICSPSDISFTATTQNAVKYFWDFSDGTGNYSDQTTATHTYSRPGSYLPKMILEDASGCPVPIVGPDSIKVNAIKTNIIAQTRVLCDSGFVNFSDSTWTNDAIGTFLWEFGDGTKSTDRAPSHKYVDAGWHTVKLTATSAFGCTDVAILDNYIKLISSPVIDIAGNLSACEPAMLTYTGNIVKADTSHLTWSWDMGNGITSDVQNPVAQPYLKAGDYPVKVTVVNSDGCTASVQKTAAIHPIPVVDAGPDSVMCKNAPITLNAVGADTYTWNFSPTLSCLNCATPSANPATFTTYKVTGKTVFGCVNTDSVSIQVRQPLDVTVNKGDTMCVGESYVLKASGADVYQWSPSTYLDDPTSATPKSKPTSTITYQVIGKDDRSCFADTGYITLQVYPIPQVEILGSNPRTLNVGSQADLTTKNSADVTSWKWYPGTALSCTTCASPIANPVQNTTYTVQATNAGGCMAKDDVTIVVVCDNTNVYVPNTFSPNGDGSNDYFYPRSNGIFTVKSFKIFNRWGQVIMAKTNVNANVASEGWDGTMNGVKLSPDVYVYCIELVCQNGATIPIIGNVTLIR